MAKKTTDGAAKAPKAKNPAPAIAADPAVSPADAIGATSTKPRASSVPPKAARAASVTTAAAPTTGPAATKPTLEITDAQIAEHAYHLWKNGTPGQQDDHWFEAERSLRSRK